MYQASQLADAQARVKELEEESLAKLFITNEDNKRTFSLLVDLGELLSWPGAPSVPYIRLRQKC